MSITPNEVRAAARAAPGPPLSEAELPETEIERMTQVLSQHGSAPVTPTTTAAPAAPESEQT